MTNKTEFARLLCYGDSNTYGYDPRAYSGGRYGAESRWVDLLARESGWEVLNRGQNGREIPRRPQEYAQAERLLSAHNAVDIFVVMLGTNDLLQGSAVPEVAARMEAFLKHIRPVCKSILLVAPPPMKYGEWVTEDSLLTASVQLAEAYRAVALRQNISFADAGEWDIALTFDGVHFSGEGHKAFAEGIWSVLKL